MPTDDLSSVPHRSLTSIAKDIWIVNDSLDTAVGARIPIRMTVIRLQDGDLLLHSPVHYSDELRNALQQLGRIRYLVAPSIAHWVHIMSWQQAVPDTITAAVPGLSSRRAVRRLGLRIDHELIEGLPGVSTSEIEVILVSAAFFVEAAILHKPTRTLVLTDLVQNLTSHDLPPGLRLLARCFGNAAPDGKAPVYLRMLMRLGGRSAKVAAARMIAFAPECVLFAHGECFTEHATARLRRSLHWLTQPDRYATLNEARDMVGLRVVITGASSGIGWATATAFAHRGATVVLAARREAVLHDLATECEALGGRTLVVPTDVTDASAVLALSDAVDNAFGGIDVWVNNAGIGVFGAFQEADLALHRRTIEVNLLGTLYGAHAVLPLFLRQQRGILINMVSLGGWAPSPFAASYTASKFGLRGFTAALRQELRGQPNIHVCGVFPAIVDTPGFSHGANISGRRLDPGPLLYQAEDVAATVVKLVRSPRDEVAVGWPSRAGRLAYAWFPRITEAATGATFRRLVSKADPASATVGALFEPTPVGRAPTGGWLARKGGVPAGTVSAWVGTVAAAVLSVAAIAAILRRRKRPL